MLPLINGVEYSYANLEFTFFNAPLAGVTSIDYTLDENVKAIEATGGYINSYTIGVLKGSGTIKMLKSTWLQILKQALNGRPSGLGVGDINISASRTGEVLKEKLLFTILNGFSSSSSAGDDKVEVSIPFMFSDYRGNVTP